MEEQAKHTPLPWEEGNPGEIWASSISDIICENCRDEDIRFIILACNSHDQLVEALKKMMNTHRVHFNCIDTSCDNCLKAYSEAEAALRAAGVEL